MINKIKSLNIKLLTLAILFFCTFTYSSCSEKMTHQESSDSDQATDAAVTEAETRVEEPQIEETITRYTYIQPVDLKREDSKNMGKLIIDARETSFKELDKNNNQIVDKEEFYNGLFKLLDANGDNIIVDEEFKLENIFLSTNPESDLNKLVAWDANENNQISENEFKSKLASIIDVPDKETLAQNLYIVWDTDNDDKIEKLELEKVVIDFDIDTN